MTDDLAPALSGALPEKKGTMTDTEMVMMCAEAMGIEHFTMDDAVLIRAPGKQHYDPLHDDAQAMALVKRFMLRVDAFSGYCGEPTLNNIHSECLHEAYSDVSLNHAIVECVAKMQRGSRHALKITR